MVYEKIGICPLEVVCCSLIKLSTQLVRVLVYWTIQGIGFRFLSPARLKAGYDEWQDENIRTGVPTIEFISLLV